MSCQIQTARLTLLACTPDMLRCAIASDREIGAYLNVRVPDHWTAFGTAPLELSLSKLLAGEAEANWWTYFSIHREEATLLGCCGYKGKPDGDGTVEIGYEITPAWRMKGLATEVAMGLIQHAFSHPEVNTVIAHTLPEVNASGRVLTKCGFTKTGEVMDPEDGLIWRWELPRHVYDQPH